MMRLLIFILVMLFLYIFSSSYLQYDELKDKFNFNIKDCFKISKHFVSCSNIVIRDIWILYVCGFRLRFYRFI